MSQPLCIAAFASRAGFLHLYTEQALEIVLDKISMGHVIEKIEGYDIMQWAAFARKKSQIASSICKELGRLKG